MPHACGVAGFLHVHAEVHHVDHDLHVRLGLIVTAHHAERHERLAVLHDERRHERVKRPLAGGEAVRVALSKRETAAAVVQHDAGAGRDDSGAEIGEQRVDERDGVPLSVGGGQIDCVAVIAAVEERIGRDLSTDHTGLVLGGRLVRIDLLPARGRVLLGDERLQELRGHAVGIGEVGRTVGEPNPLRFDEPVQIVGAVVAERLDVVALENVQHLERHEALGIGRHLVDVVAAVARVNRVHPIRLVAGEIGLGEKPAALLKVGRDGASDRALVERIASSRGHLLQRSRQVRVAEDVARPRHAPARQKHCSRGRICRQLPGRGVPLVRDDLGHGVTITCVADGRRQRTRERDRPVLRKELGPAGQRAWNRHRIRAVVGHLREASGQQHVGVGLRAGAAAGVQAPQPLCLRVVDDRKDVAADAGHRRLDDGEDGGGRDSGVDRIPTFLQHLQACGRRERLARGDQPVAREHGRTRAPDVPGGTVARLLSGEDGHGGCGQQREHGPGKTRHIIILQDAAGPVARAAN